MDPNKQDKVTMMGRADLMRMLSLAPVHFPHTMQHAVMPDTSLGSLKTDRPTTVVNGVCVPGAARTSSEPRPCCEVLIAGTNDLTVGEQRNIYRHLEGYITARSSNTEIILITLPHRHDLDPDTLSTIIPCS
ncbi:hypothetical protein J6590_096644 [Homalodisca vitripennis]|nr:hypothetical protein J6590_096644 [Homalodisca vitripennis]